jgi:tetratricopeptide (TPR) repeat protein
MFRVRRSSWICLGLVVATALVYLPILSNGFINFDDPLYVTENSRVQQGLSWSGIKWAFTTQSASNWHPLTWLSHMLDCQLYGLNSRGHHATSLWFHCANVVLLFQLLRRLTHAIWPSAFVAALFGLHPLHVESVAWIAERKDVLSTFFWLLALMAYTIYAEARKPDKESGKAEGISGSKRIALMSYLAAWFCFALGLLCKPMVVTLPFVLLLLDLWPLGRIEPVSEVGQKAALRTQFSRWRWLVVEKIPFFLLSAVASVITYEVQRSAGAMVSFDHYTLPERISTAFVSYLAYLRKLFWPTALSPIYLHPGNWSWLQITSSIACLALFCLIAVRALANPPRRLWLPCGWFWFLGTLVPVIGIIQVGNQTIADRYTYLPSVGIFIICAWGIAEATGRYRRQKMLIAGASALAVVCLGIATFWQARYWKSSETLFTHALKVSANNYIAYLNLGTDLLQRHKLQEAITMLREGLRVSHDFPEAHLSLGEALAMAGQYEEAIEHFSAAARLKPQSAPAQLDWGMTLELQGKPGQGREHFIQAVTLQPHFFEAQIQLGNSLMREGQVDDAIKHFQQAVAEKPDSAEAHHYLATAFAVQQSYPEAGNEFNATLKIQPDNAGVLNDFAWMLTAKAPANPENLDVAIKAARRACDLTSNLEPIYLDTLAAAYSEAGSFTNSIIAARAGLEAAKRSGQSQVVSRLETRLHGYESGRSLRQQQ